MELDLYTAFENASDSSQQIFRQLLKCMSEPGHIETIKEKSSTNLHDAYLTTWAVAQTLLDADCSVYLSSTLAHSKLKQSIPFFTDSAVKTAPEAVDFAFVNINELTTLDIFKTGTLESPHGSCTVIIQTEAINTNKQLKLMGPGINEHRFLNIEGITAEHIHLLQQNNHLYPCGVDFIFCSPTQITALPRSTKIQSCTALEEAA